MSFAVNTINMDTDVLIIGGGLSGCMAAIKAREYGVDVTIAEKGDTRTSGCTGTGIDHLWCYIPSIHQKLGWRIEDLIEDHIQGISGGFVDRDLLYMVVSQAFERAMDLEKFGVNFRFKDSPLPGNFRIVPQFHSVPDALNFDGRNLKWLLTKEAKKRDVHIVNRVMITDLLTSDGQVSGALGIGTRSGEVYAFRAKAVVLSTGRVSRLSRTVTGVWGNSSSPLSETGDGRSIASRAGLPLINMEFFPPPRPFAIGNNERNLGAPRNTTYPAAAVTGPKGEVFTPRTHFYDWGILEKEKVDPLETRKAWLKARQTDKAPLGELYRQGKGPFYLDLTGGTDEEIKYIEWSISNEGRGYLFLNYLKEQEHFDFRKDKIEMVPTTRGLASNAASGVIVNGNLETDIKGLYAAGDDVGGVPWKSAPGAVTMGWNAGEQAAMRARSQKRFLPQSHERLNSLEAEIRTMLTSKKGTYWREAELALQNLMDYYCGEVRAEEMLKRGIGRLDELGKLVSFKAGNPHELTRCMEVRSLMENAAMIMRSSLERQETRRSPFQFVRVDFPEQDDENWFTFLGIQRKENKFIFSKLPIRNKG